MSKEPKVEKPESLLEKKTEPDPAVKRTTPSFGLPLGPAKQIEVTLPSRLVVVLTTKAFSQLFAYAEATQLEVSLLGIVDRDSSKFTVREFFLVPQSGATSHTETDPAAIGELIERLMSEDRAGDAKKIRCWAHSHPGMDVFWSKTDDDNCRRMCSEWLVSVVVSDGFRVRCRLDVASPVSATFDWLPVYCESPVDAAVAEQCKREVKDKIKLMPMFGFGKTAKHEKAEKTRDPKDRPVELVDYCELCGGWHADGQCPMELETSAYELAHREREAEEGVWEDGVWF